MQYFAWIENTARIEGALNGAHEIKLHLRRVTFELVDFQLADAVLGTETAAEFLHEIMQCAFDGRLAREKDIAIRARCLIEIEVQVTIPHVTVSNESPVRNVFGEPLPGAVDKLWQNRDRQG